MGRAGAGARGGVKKKGTESHTFVAAEAPRGVSLPLSAQDPLPADADVRYAILCARSRWPRHSLPSRQGREEPTGVPGASRTAAGGSMGGCPLGYGAAAAAEAPEEGTHACLHQ